MAQRSSSPGHGDEGEGADNSGSTTPAARASRKACPATGGYSYVFRRNVIASGVIPQYFGQSWDRAAGGAVYVARMRPTSSSV